jgi:hypothetical protein
VEQFILTEREKMHGLLFPTYKETISLEFTLIFFGQRTSFVLRERKYIGLVPAASGLVESRSPPSGRQALAEGSPDKEEVTQFRCPA